MVQTAAAPLPPAGRARLRKAVGHADMKTTQGYSSESQRFEGEVDRWPDRWLWLRRPVPAVVGSKGATG